MGDFGKHLQQLHSASNYTDCPACSNCSIGNLGKRGHKKCELANVNIRDILKLNIFLAILPKGQTGYFKKGK